jgi:hypothetical protein
VQPGDPRADPTVVDLIELAGLWVAAGDWAALLRTLRRLNEQLELRFPGEAEFASRFHELQRVVEAADGSRDEEIRRSYRQATFG